MVLWVFYAKDDTGSLVEEFYFLAPPTLYVHHVESVREVLSTMEWAYRVEA